MFISWITFTYIQYNFKSKRLQNVWVVKLSWAFKGKCSTEQSVNYVKIIFNN